MISRCLLLTLLAASPGSGQSSLDWSRSWLEEDVRYIISDQDRQAFSALQTEQERREFIDHFWLRHDPTPDTPENEFEEEHYRRFAYANQHFSSESPGWKTDRGMLYIKYGPPDEIESTPPNEVWRYRYIDDIGVNIEFRFSDRSGKGNYTFADHAESLRAAAKPIDCLLVLSESTGELNQKRICVSPHWLDEDVDYLEVRPEVKDLDAIVNSADGPGRLLIQSDVRFDKLTRNMTSVNLAVRLPQVPDPHIEIYGSIAALDRNFKTNLNLNCSAGILCKSDVLLQPGSYNLSIVVKDNTTNTAARSDQLVAVPSLGAAHLTNLTPSDPN